MVLALLWWLVSSMIQHSHAGGGVAATRGQSACSPGLLGSVTSPSRWPGETIRRRGGSEEVKYGRHLILTTGWISVQEFELRRRPHATATSSRVQCGSPWRMKAKIGFVGLFPPYIRTGPSCIPCCMAHGTRTSPG